MEHDKAALLLGAFAVHALDENEDLEVSVHLEVCARCRAEVSQYERIVGLLGYGDPPRDT
jgi:anti-sigma factor ChrR (cupin superfamily)